MNLDRSILHWIQSTMTCPALDFLIPKITALGNGGAIWLAVLIAFSRLYLYAHFPNDILGAAGLGVVIGLLMFRYGGHVLDHPMAPTGRH